MDDKGILSVSDFCNLDKKVERITIRSGAVMGRVQPDPNILPKNRIPQRVLVGRDYAKKYVEEEERLLLQGHASAAPERDIPGSSALRQLCEMEECTSMGSVPNMHDVEDDQSLVTYDLYDFSPNHTTLPIEDKREHIVRMIETNQVVIILGATGCGKTTQVPQFILDHHANVRKKCNIIVTQPRRIAAASVAKRVCNERNWELSTIVGYKIGLENKTSADTRLTYCTTGVLREILVRKGSLLDYTHIVIDEVHERDLETDFIMLIVRKLLRTNSRTVKVILMSATIDPSQFANYFSSPIGKKLCPAPILEVEKLTPYKVDEFYIEQLRDLGNVPNFEVDNPKIHEDAMNIAIKLILYLDKIDSKTSEKKPSVLVFVPGLHEIESLLECLEEKKNQDKQKWHLVPLHSTISKDSQNNVFKEPKPGYRKIIISTNIAESSITVTDVVYVIDFCLTKHLVCDPVTNFTSLHYAWAAHSNCKQRAGRSGRTQPGRVYRMVTRRFYEECLPTESDPEMVRCPLSQTVLKAKMLKMGEPKAVLAYAIDPPDLTRIQTTILQLKEAGALLMTCEGRPSLYDGDITFLGTVMSHLPLDIQLSKLIMLGHVFSILDDTIIMAAWMTVRNVFKTDFYERLGPYGAKVTYTAGSSSDCIAYRNIHTVFADKLQTNYFKTSNDSEAGWCKRNYLNYKAMYEANELIDELRKRLKNLGVYEMVGEGGSRWDTSELPFIWKVVIAGAFYPNYFVRGAQYGQIDEEDAVKVLSGKDPFSTVYLRGMPSNQPGELYAQTIKDIMERHAGVVSNVSFDGSSKVYVQFERDRNKDLPGLISYPVYRAVKMRQLRIPIDVPMLTPTDAQKRMEEYEVVANRYLSLGKLRGSSGSRLPNPFVQDIEFVPCYVNDPNCFWIHTGIGAELESIQQKLNSCGNTFSLSDKLVVGGIYAAPYPQKKGALYRAQICAIHKEADTAKVFFIDYGNVDDNMPTKSIFEMGPDIQDLRYPNRIPPFALECTLKGVGPSFLENQKGIWSPKSIQKFGQLLSVGKCSGEVYSLVDGRLSLIVKRHGFEKSINEEMVDLGLAVQVEESYRSKMSNMERVQTRDSSKSATNEGHQQATEQSAKTLLCSQVDSNVRKNDEYVKPPLRQECKKMVTLKGPTSSLEMRVFGCTRVSHGKEVSMDIDSVNSVLLDSAPEDPHNRLLVAGFCATNSEGSKLKLGHTTLMPNLHGLAALMCVIFAPKIELRLSVDKSKYIGALCGLGCDETTGESYFPENEMEVPFDCLFDLDDLVEVNRLRYWMSKPLQTAMGDDMCDADPAQIQEAQEKVRKSLMRLIVRQRPSQNIENFSKDFQWNQFNPEHLLEPSGQDERSVYQPHYGLMLED